MILLAIFLYSGSSLEMMATMESSNDSTAVPSDSALCTAFRLQDLCLDHGLTIVSFLYLFLEERIEGLCAVFERLSI
jgi:hypothetical protein